MKIVFSSKKKLIKLAEDERRCRLCGKPGEDRGSVAVIPYSLEGESSVTEFHREEVTGCPTCNTTGVIKSEPPTYTECNTCKKGSKTARGVGQGPGVYKPNVCPTCYNQGIRLVPVHGGDPDAFAERRCRTCDGNKNNIPIKECPTCIGVGTERPGFVQHGESQHNIVCPTCRGSKKRKIEYSYTPILQVACPHDSIDTRTKPNVEGATDNIGAYDQNYFEGQRLIPARLFWQIRGLDSKYKHQRKDNLNIKEFDEKDKNGNDKIDRSKPREIGQITPPIPPIKSGGEPSYLDFVSRPNLLDPPRSRTASNIFKNIKNKFNSKTAKDEEPHESTGSTSDNNDFADDFFGIPEQPNNSPGVDDFDDVWGEGLSLDPIPESKRKLSPEQQKRLHGGPVTVRQVDESDKLRSFLRNPTRAIRNTRSLLNNQKTLIEKRNTMSKMFKGMNDLEAKTAYEDTDSAEQKAAKDKEHSLGLRRSYRGWRDNLQQVSLNLDDFGQLRGALRRHLSKTTGKRVDPDIATALASQVFREGRPIKQKDGSVVDLSQRRMGITEPMPYFKNDENWRESHQGFGCNHDPGGGHEPDVGCIVDFHNPADNPKEGVTTGINSRIVTGKYAGQDGKTILQTSGARLERARESGLPKQSLRGATPRWVPESFGRTVELPAERATCVPNKIQREHYVVNHTVEPASEKAESISLPVEETGIPGRKPEPVLHKEKIKFPEEIREGGPTESVYVGNPLYQLNNPFSKQEIEKGMWANNPAVQHLAKQIKNGKRPEKFKPYVPEPKFNSQQLRDREGLTGPPAPSEDSGGFDLGDIDIDSWFDDVDDEKPPKTSNKFNSTLNPVEEDKDDTYDTDKKLKVQKMQRTQVHMVEPSNASTPDITPDVPQVNYN